MLLRLNCIYCINNAAWAPPRGPELPAEKALMLLYVAHATKLCLGENPPADACRCAGGSDVSTGSQLYVSFHFAGSGCGGDNQTTAWLGGQLAIAAQGLQPKPDQQKAFPSPEGRNYSCLECKGARKQRSGTVAPSSVLSPRVLMNVWLQ
ncbi:hematopoietically-expressed homeobox protein HHEX [Platysternon megacephalum]|uniref:Hematopoietically-expressed homeobox protein HHEX n=1 Tax=Platysternon megacephalum TaxID=55544 RepID=A0A4D9EA79_9SAUR|nr:hematopoietically-expressed homeobox protein HHEX [Platysternon megacephalum]